MGRIQNDWDIQGANEYDFIRGRMLQAAGDHKLNASHEGQSQSKITVQSLMQEIRNL